MSSLMLIYTVTTIFPNMLPIQPFGPTEFDAKLNRFFIKNKHL